MFLRRVVLCLLPLLALIGSLNAAANENKIEVLPDPKPIPKFVLQNQHGKNFAREDLLGKWSMIFVGFTSCPDVCPYTLRNLESVRSQLGLRMMPDSLPEIIFLAVDPERDKANLAAYLAHFHGEFIGITGEQEQIDQLINGMGAYYKFDKKKSKQNYNVIHSSAIMLVNPEAKVVAELYPPLLSAPAATSIFQIMRGIELEQG